MTTRFTLRPSALFLPYLCIIPCLVSITRHAEPSTVVATSLLAVFGLLLNALPALADLCADGMDNQQLNLRRPAWLISLVLLSLTPLFSLFHANPTLFPLGLYGALLAVFILAIPALAPVLLHQRATTT